MHRCQGLMYLLRNKELKAANSFRKAIKFCLKNGMEYEYNFNKFLLRTYCKQYFKKGFEEGPGKVMYGNGISSKFCDAFNMTMQTWKTSVSSCDKEELLHFLSESPDGAFVSKRTSLFNSNNSNSAVLNNVSNISALGSGSFVKRLIQRSSFNDQNASSNDNNKNCAKNETRKLYENSTSKASNILIAMKMSDTDGVQSNLIVNTDMPVGFTRRASDTAQKLQEKIIKAKANMKFVRRRSLSDGEFSSPGGCKK